MSAALESLHELRRLAVCEHGHEDRYTSSGTPLGYCGSCDERRSYWGRPNECSACYVGRMHSDCR